jgi:DNA repair protein RAD50
VHTGTEEELQERSRNFDRDIEKEKIARNRREVERQDLEDELAKTRRSHVELINEHGELAAEAKVLLQFSSVTVL